MNHFFHEFKAFINRGNVIDLAVGIIIGAAFQGIVGSLVKDVITPPIGLLIGGVNFENLKFVIGGETANPVTINYGAFLQASLSFLIISFTVFLLIQALGKLRQAEETKNPLPPPEPSAEVKLLSEIRDLLKSR